MNIKIQSLSLLAVSLLAGAVQAQTVEFMGISRGEDWQQISADVLQEFEWDSPYWAEAFIEWSEGTITDAVLVHPTEGSFPFEVDGSEVYLEGDYDSAAEMMAEWVAGTYTFQGTGSSIGAFSIEAQVDAYTPLAKKKITNFDALQSADPTQDIVIEWEPFTDAGELGLIFVEISYYVDEHTYVNDVWVAPDSRTDGLPGLPADATSVVIPANTLQGSPYNQYDVWVEFVSAKSAGDSAPFDGAFFIVTTETSTFFHLKTPAVTPKDPYLGTWPVGASDWTNATGWFGWLWVGEAPWAYSLSLGAYVYVQEATFEADAGAWVYVPYYGSIAGGAEDFLGLWPVSDYRTETTGWLGTLWTEYAPWVYSESLRGWICVAAETFSPEAGGWVYVPTQE